MLFINTKEITVKWGTKNAINIPAQGLPGGMPIRAFGTFNVKIDDYQVLIDKIAGIKVQYTVDDVKERVMSKLDQLLMKHISKEGQDMFHLQAYADDIAKGIREDLDMDMRKIGIAITDFAVSSFNYPEEIQKMAEKVASQSMIGGNMATYQQVAMTDALAKGNGAAGSTAATMMGMGAGLEMGRQMVQSMQQANQANQTSQATAAKWDNSEGNPAGSAPKFCPNCGTPTNGAKFCSNCGTKLI